MLNESADGQVSLRQIARAAGYSPSALYRYFPTKAALVYAVREDHLRLSTEFAQAEVVAVNDPLSRLCTAFEAMVAFWAHLRACSGMTQPGDQSHAAAACSRAVACASRRRPW